MIKLVAYTSSTNKLDITKYVTSVNWSGDINTLPRKLELDLKTTSEVGDKPIFALKPGNLIVFYKDNEELFRGYIFVKSISDNGDESLTVYDQLIYVTKNADTLFIKQKSASDIIISSLKKFGMKVGSIESTGHKIKQLLVQNQSLSEIFDQCLEETKKFTGKSYKIWTSKGLVYMKSRAKAAKKTIAITNIISGSKEISIEDVRTKVMVTKGSLEAPKKNKDGSIEKGYVAYRSVSVENKDAINKYGIMQQVEDVDDKTSVDMMKKKAQAVLNQLSKPEETISIEFIGDVDCITGNMIEVSNETTNIIGKFYITSDSHTFSDGTHKMTLQLSNKLE